MKRDVPESESAGVGNKAKLAANRTKAAFSSAKSDFSRPIDGECKFVMFELNCTRMQSEVDS